MVANGITEYSGEELPEEQNSVPQPPAAHDIETIFCPGDRIGGYEIERVLGIGSTAVVYGASQLSASRHVALKVPLARLNRKSLFAQHFAKEAARIAPLNHPNLVNTLDSGRQGDHHYFVLEHVEGVPLETAIVRGILSYGDYLAVIRQVREALKYIHGEGLPHLDVKTSNIFLSRNGQVKIGDFALAHLALSLGEWSSSGENYRAPELRVGRCSLGPQTDVYSLGVTYHKMFCRAFPENGQSRASALNPSLPKAVDGVLQEAIALNPEDRYDSVQGFTVELLSSLMGMAAFFQIDQITEESELLEADQGQHGPQNSASPSQPEPIAAPPPRQAASAPPAAEEPSPSTPPSPPVSGFAAPLVEPPRSLSPTDAPLTIQTPEVERTVPQTSTGRITRPALWAAAAVLALGIGTAAYFALSQGSASEAPVTAVPPAPPAKPTAAPQTQFAGVLSEWLPSSHPEVTKALAEGRPVAIYFRRSATSSLPWGDFEAYVLGSELVQQKLAGVVRAVEDLDGTDKPLVRKFGKGEERVLTVVGKNGRSIARFNADTTADQVAYALGLM